MIKDGHLRGKCKRGGQSRSGAGRNRSPVERCESRARQGIHRGKGIEAIRNTKYFPAIFVPIRLCRILHAYPQCLYLSVEDRIRARITQTRRYQIPGSYVMRSYASTTGPRPSTRLPKNMGLSCLLMRHRYRTCLRSAAVSPVYLASWRL